jgi:hypothetical protein
LGTPADTGLSGANFGMINMVFLKAVAHRVIAAEHRKTNEAAMRFGVAQPAFRILTMDLG